MDASLLERMSHLVSRTQLSWFSLYPSGNLLLCPLLVLSHLPNLGAYARSSFYSLLVISPIFQAIPKFTYQLYESPKPRSGFCVTASASPADSSLTRWLPVGGSVVKNLPAMQETPIQFLGGEDPLEEEMATPSSILARKIPGTEEPCSPKCLTHTHTTTCVVTTVVPVCKYR